jgi:hypothetical protein
VAKTTYEHYVKCFDINAYNYHCSHTHSQITKFNLNGTSPQMQGVLEFQITNNVLESHNFDLYPTHEIS